MKDIVNSYIKALNEPNHRYLSFEHCYEAFGNPENSINSLTLHLAFYLASWGMYRGSSTLLKKDYTVHTKIVEYIRPIALKREEIGSIKDVQQIMNELSQKYREVGVESSKILQTKVMLGTLGCFPALDRFFIDGWKMKFKENPTGENIFTFVLDNMNEIKDCQKIVNRDIAYPPMKIVDMYFWQLGYDEFQKKKCERIKAAR